MKRYIAAAITALLCMMSVGCSDGTDSAAQLSVPEAVSKKVYTDKAEIAVAETSEALLTYINLRDSEAIKALFSPDARSRAADMDAEIGRLFELFPEPIDSFDYDGKNQEGGSLGGGRSHDVSTWFCVYSGGERYYCSIDMMLENTWAPDTVGVTALAFTTENTFCHEDFSWGEDCGVSVITEPRGDYLTARIEGYPKIFTPHERSVEVADIEAFLEESVSFASFLERFGAPDAGEIEAYSICFYELDTDGDERLFAKVCADGELENIDIVSEYEWLYELWSAE